MPVINFSRSDLENLMGVEVSMDTLRERLPMIGADLKLAEDGKDELTFEFFPDRPDLYSVEGIARALKAFLDIEPGLREYTVDESHVRVVVEPSVNAVRPYIWSAIVEDLTFDDPLIRSMMDLQEKLHVTIGRDRRKVAIGIHDIETVEAPFTYKAVLPDEVTFFPLQGTREMTPSEVLTDHDKGKAYAFVLEGKERYPLITDKNGVVLSMPPIINGITTEVTEKTKNVFVDCTGTDINALKYSVNILTAALADRGGHVGTVTIEQGGEELIAPDMRGRDMDLDVAYANRWLGTDMDAEEMVGCLGRMGHGAAANGGRISVRVPSYRADILHPVDIAEDVAIGHGYETFGNVLPKATTFGVEDPLVSFATRVRPIVTGLGFFEVATLSLSNAQEQFTALGLDENSEALRILNPVTEMHTLVRTSLLPSLLSILRKNKHRELPQRIFEIGDVVEGIANKKRLGGVTIHAKASFTECKSIIQSLSAALGFTCDIAAAEHPAYVPGRCAYVSAGSQTVGVFGEVHPHTIESFELKYPVVAFEMYLDKIHNMLETRDG
ncbi:MAG TPA: phenylalanine--tRNA ligase subunit beta [Thermoplasmata archaeon]|nr:phenylalanine--tRNA ligase subunit beta [Thermoplasmata archaeon]